MTEAERKAWNAAIEAAAGLLDLHDGVPLKAPEKWPQNEKDFYESGQLDASLSWQDAIRSLAKPEAE